jgi:predicted SAM-dependent methyltransferase
MNKLCVQFGAGGNILEGWQNHDADVNITEKLPYFENTVDEILCEHCVEHVSTPDFFRFLMECHRILKPKGSLLLCVPVLDLVDPDHACDLILGHGHEAAYTVDSLMKIVMLAPFSKVKSVFERPEICGHWKIIGEAKDTKETCRLLCVK